MEKKMYSNINNRVVFTHVVKYESANRVRATLIILPITFEHVMVRLTSRKFFGSASWPPVQIGDTLAVSQSFGNRPESIASPFLLYTLRGNDPSEAKTQIAINNGANASTHPRTYCISPPHCGHAIKTYHGKPFEGR